MCGKRTLFLFAMLLVLPFTLAAQKTCQSQPGLLRVVDHQGRTGFIDSKGKIVIRPERFPVNAVQISDFSEGLAPVAFNLDPNNRNPVFIPGVTLFGFVDTTGRVVIKPQYQYAYNFCDGLAYVQTDDFHGYIDKAGKAAIDVIKDCAGFAVTASDLLERCPPFLAEGYRHIGEYSEGLLAITDGNSGRIAKYGFIDLQGRMVIAPRFEPELEHHGFITALSKFSDGVAKVKIGGKYGYVNKRGKLVIDTRFDTASDFAEGLAFVSLKGKLGYIGKSGKWAIRLKDSSIGNRFSEGLAAVNLLAPDGQYHWGYIDRKGRVMIEPKFQAAMEFRDGVARIYESGGRIDEWESRYGYIDRNGKYIWKPGSTFPDESRLNHSHAKELHSSQSP